MDHTIHDRISLALAKEIAHGLADHPEWIELARANINAWSRRNASAPALLRCYHEWQAILDLPVDRVIRELLRDDETGQRLRQNSPFAGALDPATVRRIRQRVMDAARAA